MTTSARAHPGTWIPTLPAVARSAAATLTSAALVGWSCAQAIARETREFLSRLEVDKVLARVRKP